ncbi:phosphotransferase [Vibrio fluvialis]|uniref:phosphotransferase n=1 Tax=Vibrio fluvialis TaxID=676 RepID=UPI001BB043CE|nr:phosphotransferase [Vibrio fluvialis]EKO3501157.1 phosphotransferase [Vibrio fluvialis]EKO3971446.1 thiamine kinase [Vibrio fluvialis]EKZ9002416.1 phosphotransferase [Vibrio fluvialis]ELI1831423.1 phosphotransferase [Vibrio fluvialis]QUF69745.1 phosphotransferase [Vibrio fluvialis]
MARMSWREACQLDPTLQSLTHFFSFPPEYAQTLTGGLTNRCWKVVCSQGKAYVWRPTTPITKAFSISRFQEYQILKSIESSHIGPAAVYVNDQGLLVEWIEGESLTNNLPFDSLLRTQIRIHELNVSRIPVAPFSFTARVDHYWMQLKSEFKTVEIHSLYQAWRTTPNTVDVLPALCHFDLAGYNMVKTAQGNKVIDWEYAAIADPRMDLALSINVAGEKILDSVFRYCQLRDIDDVDVWVDGVQAWLPRTTMMAMLWYLLAFQLWGDDSYYQQALHIKETFCS